VTATIRVLHVDDDTEFASLAAASLEAENEALAVESEPDAERALERLDGDAEVFDCVVSDYEMPQVSGLEFLRAVRDVDDTMPVIFFTGHGSEAVASDAISAGVTDYIQKRGYEQYTLLANRIVNYVEKRRAEEERLRGYEAIERAREGISILDAGGRYVYTNEAFADLVGYDRDELLGQHWELLYRAEDRQRVYDEQLPAAANGGWTGQTVYRRKDGDLVLTNHSLSYTEDGELVSVAQDITDDERRRQELLEAKRFESLVTAVTEYAVFMLDTEGEIVTWNEGAADIGGYSEREALGEHVSLLYTPEDVAEGLPEHLLAQALEAGGVEDEGWRVRRDGQRYWAHVVITPVFDDDGTHQGFALVTRDMTERRARENELEAQRASLAAANRMNEVLRDILRRIVHDSSRRDIEQDVCDRLTGDGPYLFAASVDCTRDGGFDVRLASGLAADAAAYVFEHVTSRGSIERAYEAGTVEVQHVDSEAVGLDHDIATAIRSVVCVPLTYRDTTYGLVLLCSTTANGLTDDERGALAGIGTAAGYGIHAVETEHLLQADGVVELVLETTDPDDPLVELGSGGGTAMLDRLVPIDDRQYLVYVTLDGVAPMDRVAALAPNPAVEEVTVVHDRKDEGGVIALTVTDVLVSYLASMGTKVHTMEASDGRLRVMVDVSPNADVGRLLDEVRAAFPDCGLVSKRQVARPVKRTQAVAETVESRLTQRQLSALQAAYHGGYFERPRRQTAEDVAATMGISASTFHQHLRIALETVLTELFD
jgi:PAS domain S-box-containing protein